MGSKIGNKLYEPSILKGRNFLISSSYLSIFSVTDAPKGGFHLLFEHYKQCGPPPKGPHCLSSKPYLKCLDISLPTLPWISIRASPVLKSMLRFPS